MSVCSEGQPSSLLLHQMCLRDCPVLILRYLVGLDSAHRASFLGHFSVVHQILVEIDAEQAANELTGRNPPCEKGEYAPEEKRREDST